MMPDELTHIIRAVCDTLRGDADAYSIIVSEYMNKLYRKALSLCRDSAEAEDLVQETLIDGYLHLSQLREADKIEGWLMRILRNKTLNYITRAKKHSSIDELAEIADRRTPEAMMVTGETMREWKNRLESLSPALRETAMLYFWHRLTMEQIAEITETPVGTVKRRIHDAREKLKKENGMESETIKLPDGFAEALSVKIKELASYTKTYGHTGFDSAYRNVKELIAGLSDRENVKKYTLESAAIAAEADLDKYAEEALETFRKYGNVIGASGLYLDLAWKNDDYKYKSDYTLETVIPALLEYPESAERAHALGNHWFWMANYANRIDASNTAEVRKYLDLAAAEFEKTTLVDAMQANTVSAIKALDCLGGGGDMKYAQVTGETWLMADDNIYYFSQPGCSYTYSALWKFMNYITYYAGAAGDGYFFPRNASLAVGESEDMNHRRTGEYYGKRTLISTDETVVTPAGTFENCLRIRKTDTEGDTFDTWYADGVGIVKSTHENDAYGAKVLSEYEIRGGDGYLPIAVGNRWCYVTPDRPDALLEKNEYVIERMGNYFYPEALSRRDFEGCRAVSVSCLNYFALREDWRTTTDDSALLFAHVSQLCDEKKYPEAADALRSIVMANKNRESVDTSLELLRVIEEKLPMDEKNWRFCPSSANISKLEVKDGIISYGESDYEMLDIGVWGSRNPEDRIFGVKPFRYLSQLCGTLWSEKWVPGYTEERAHSWDENVKVRITVDEGGTVETPAGTFEDTIHVTVDCGDCANPEYFFYFYNNTHHGRKEFWFARGVGPVRFKCTWGDKLSTDAPLTKYHVISRADEMMPVHIGNSWQYDEATLTSENYIARREYKVISGMKMLVITVFTASDTLSITLVYPSRMVVSSAA